MTVATLPIKPPDVITQEFLTPRAVRRGVIAGIVGNVLEWYGFALFGFFALQIGTHFFPAGNPTASLLTAFGTFAAGLHHAAGRWRAVRLGGGRYGRRLIRSVLAMAFPSFFIGVLPSAATIGLAAPILLLLFRLLQGLAVGGQYIASAVFLVDGSEVGRRGARNHGGAGAVAGALHRALGGIQRGDGAAGCTTRWWRRLTKEFEAASLT